MHVISSNLEGLVTAVRQMRRAQRRYALVRGSANLRDQRRWEMRVDHLVADIMMARKADAPLQSVEENSHDG